MLLLALALLPLFVNSHNCSYSIQTSRTAVINAKGHFSILSGLYVWAPCVRNTKHSQHQFTLRCQQDVVLYFTDDPQVPNSIYFPLNHTLGWIQGTFRECQVFRQDLPLKKANHAIRPSKTIDNVIKKRGIVPHFPEKHENFVFLEEDDQVTKPDKNNINREGSYRRKRKKIKAEDYYASSQPEHDFFMSFIETSSRVVEVLRSGVRSKQIVAGIIDSMKAAVPPVMIQMFMEVICPQIQSVLEETLMPVLMGIVMNMDAIGALPPVENMASAYVPSDLGTPPGAFIEEGGNSGVSHKMKEILTTEIGNSMLANDLKECSEMLHVTLSATLPVEVGRLIERAVARTAFAEVVSYLTSSLTGKLSESIFEQLQVRAIQLAAESLTPSVTHGVSYAVTRSLRGSSIREYFCYYCRTLEQEQYCQQCIQSKQVEYYEDYLVHQYARYYSGYYAARYAEESVAQHFIEKNKEKESSSESTD